MWRALLKWIDDYVFGAAARRAAQEEFVRDQAERQAKWDALPVEEKAARQAKWDAERDAAVARHEQEALKTFPFEIVTVRGDQALETFERLRAEGRGTPVIIGQEDLARVNDQIGYARRDPRRATPQAILARAAKLNFPSGQIKEFAEARARETPDDEDEDFFPVGEAPPDDAPAKLPARTYQITDLKRAVVERCHIAILPTDDWTEAPAYLAFGGFNACPNPEDHIAAMRYWRDRYGAELLHMTGDVLEFRIARPPRTGVEAMALAEEHYAYCGSQGAESMGEIAEGLQNDPYWFFWWD